jgi:hypothetical protein
MHYTELSTGSSFFDVGFWDLAGYVVLSIDRAHALCAALSHESLGHYQL